MDRGRLARLIVDMHDRLTQAGMNDAQACATAGAAMGVMLGDGDD